MKKVSKKPREVLWLLACVVCGDLRPPLDKRQVPSKSKVK